MRKLSLLIALILSLTLTSCGKLEPTTMILTEERLMSYLTDESALNTEALYAPALISLNSYIRDLEPHISVEDIYFDIHEVNNYGVFVCRLLEDDDIVLVYSYTLNDDGHFMTMNVDYINFDRFQVASSVGPLEGYKNDAVDQQG